MSEVQSRPAAPRGRASARGGRGGYAPRGGRTTSRTVTTNGDKTDVGSKQPPEDEGEVGLLKKKYASSLSTIKEMFPDWTDEDVVFALQETNGDLQSTIENITEGNVTQWGEVKKKSKDRSRSKVKDAVPSNSTDVPTLPSGRGGRGGRMASESRGGRGRGSDRSRTSGRGARAGSAMPNGHGVAGTQGADAAFDTKTSVPTDESSAWDTSASKPKGEVGDMWDTTNPPDKPEVGGSGSAAAASNANTSTTATRPGTSVIPGGATKSWASMFAKPKPPPAPKKAPATPAAKTGEKVAHQPESLPPPPVSAAPAADLDGLSSAREAELETTITPSKDELTETNLEQVFDASAAPATMTAASTVASSKDPRSAGDTPTPYSSLTQNASPAPASGYAATAYKATATPARTSSFQRRVLNQQEAVVMPGNHAVDRTAVQFGSLGLNGGSDDQDVDEDREEAETRAQPPQHSPVAHPVASLPPAPNQPHGTQPNSQEPMPTPRQAPGLPAPQPQQAGPTQEPAGQTSVGPQSMAPQTSQGSQPYGQFNRYAQPNMSQEQPAAAQKPYDPFGQTSHGQPSQYDGYGSQSAAPQGQPQHAPQSQLGSYSSAPNDYSSYYTSDQQQRGGYGNYYGSQYGQQTGQTQMDAGNAQARSGSGYGHAAADSYPSSQPQQPQSRYGQAAEPQTSGHTTPNPAMPGHQGAQSQASQPMGQQPGGQAGGHGSYPYGHPYYSSPYYNAYMNQFGYGQGYGNGPYGGKGSMYGQPHPNYGMSPQSSYEHSASPANLGGFGQPSQHGRDGAGSGLNDYGRTGSAQPSQSQQQSQQPSGGSAFGGMPDVFGRSGFQQAGQPLGQHSGNSQLGDDAMKGAFGDAGKSASGPSPSMNPQPTGGRPGSAVNNNTAPGGQAAAGSQSQNQPGGYGGYPNHLNHNNQHGSQGAGQYGGGFGGLGGHQAAGGAPSHQASGGYGNYGANAGGAGGYGGSYYGSSGRGGAGWGGSYGH
ncbi:MAG: hypothetical protein M1817_000024 [Caeruleum heppii]|nr:MAG: hypothetical protein M1817_000024 [Caeruleum heppii]